MSLLAAVTKPGYQSTESTARSLEPVLHLPDKIAEKLTFERYEEMEGELRELIRNTIPQDTYRRITNGSDGFTEFERETVLVGLVLRLSQKEILREINRIRQIQGIKPLDHFYIGSFKRRYGTIIDELYANAAIRIGEIYKYSDKLFRIGRYNELAGVLHKTVVDQLEMGIDEDIVIKKAHLYLKVLQNLNAEMGNVTMKDMIRRRPKEDADEDRQLNKDEFKELVAQMITDRYKHILPPSISQKIEFSDYLNCANGEKMGDWQVVCWNEKMTSNNAGTQCPVQAGKLHKCPKMLNRSLLDNKEWLVTTREKHL